MHWIYVLQCEDGHVYVGQTQRLFARFADHFSRKVINTGIYRPYALIGLYKVANNISFMEYHHTIKYTKSDYHPNLLLDWGNDSHAFYMVENLITERYMYEKKEDWWKVRGGKYTKIMDDVNVICFPWTKQHFYKKIQKKTLLDRPLCHCGYPCEVVKTQKNQIMFKCPLNIQKELWHNQLPIHISEPCSFFEPYKEDEVKKNKYLALEELFQEYSSETWVDHLPILENRHCYNHHYPCLVCKKKKYFSMYAKNAYRQVCKQCFIKKYETLKKDFSQRPKYVFLEEKSEEENSE